MKRLFILFHFSIIVFFGCNNKEVKISDDYQEEIKQSTISNNYSNDYVYPDKILEKEYFYVVPSEGLNLREWHGLTSNIIKLLPQYTRLKEIEKIGKVNIDGLDDYWYYVDTGSECGWVFGAYLISFKDLAETRIEELRKGRGIPSEEEYAEEYEKMCAEYTKYEEPEVSEESYRSLCYESVYLYKISFFPTASYAEYDEILINETGFEYEYYFIYNIRLGEFTGYSGDIPNFNVSRDAVFTTKYNYLDGNYTIFRLYAIKNEFYEKVVELMFESDKRGSGAWINDNEIRINNRTVKRDNSNSSFEIFD